MNIGIITTSRADFGIYLPLLKEISKSPHLNYFLFVGGMHTSKKFGYSYKLIEEEGFVISELLETMSDDDSSLDISLSMAKTIKSYAMVWEKYYSKLDLIFVLGDRFEMFAAASSIIPFKIKIAHLHGGETTLGAIDNKFRHAITALSDFHFTSNEIHSKRVSEIIGTNKNVYTVGALGIDNIVKSDVYTKTNFQEKYDFDIDQNYVLMTFHPETVCLNNEKYISELIGALESIDMMVLCTLPNADMEGSIIREKLLEYEQNNKSKIKCFENLGQKGYLTAMKNAYCLLGNTSSGIIEAASFNKMVVNIGDRQKGRLCGNNVIHCKIIKEDILSAMLLVNHIEVITFKNTYGNGDAAPKIIKILEEINN